MIRFLLTLATVVLISGCSSVSVQRDYDTSIDFSMLKTYAWKYATQPKTGNPQIDNDLQDKRIRTAINAILEVKGFAPAEPDRADVLVAYYMESKRRISGDTWVFGFGTGLYDGFGGIGYNTSISDYDEGYLTIDVIGGTSGKTIWRGVGRRATYEDPDPEKGAEIIHSAVAKILADFPPKP